MTRQTRGEPLSEVAGLHRMYNGPVDTFYDAQTHGPLHLELRRITPDDWRILRRFGYHHHNYSEPFVCPHDVDDYSTDLASTPWIFQWVVPPRGIHFPAIMLHDALVADPAEPTHLGPAVTREQADGIMRDAMKSLGVGLIRRWLAWTGAFVATAASAMRPRWWWWAVLVLTFGGIATMGVLATVDLFDGAEILPWMADRSWTTELLTGALGALLIPAALSVLWGKRWRAGLIGGIALAGLLHVTIIMAATYVVYRVLERLTMSQRRTEAEIQRDEKRLSDNMRVEAQFGKGSGTYVDMRVPRSSVRVAVTGPQMLVSGLKLVTDLGVLDGHDYPALQDLAQRLKATSHCGRVGPTELTIGVEVDRQGPVLVIDVGPSSMYETVLEIATINDETFEQLIKKTIGRRTGRGFVAGLVPVAATSHEEVHGDGQVAGHTTDISLNPDAHTGNELTDPAERELAHGHS